MNAYLDAMRAYRVFEGRTSRTAYWRAHLVFGPLMLVAFVGLGLPFTGETRSVWPALLFGLIVLPHAVPWAALTVRRLHDMGQPEWWALLALAPAVEIVPWGMVALLLWCCQRGQAGANRYGLDPFDRAAPDDRPPAGLPAAMAQPAAARVDLTDELERLARLREDGTLSEAEFAALKAHALTRGPA